MAIYEYECNQCGERFELRRMMSERDEDAQCPRCGAKKPKRIISMFGGSGSGDSCGSITGVPGGG